MKSTTEPAEFAFDLPVNQCHLIPAHGQFRYAAGRVRIIHCARWTRGARTARATCPGRGRERAARSATAPAGAPQPPRQRAGAAAGAPATRSATPLRSGRAVPARAAVTREIAAPPAAAVGCAARPPRPASRHRRPWRAAKDFYWKAYEDNLTGLSGMVAYNLLLSVFPLALLALFIAGRVLGAGDLEQSVLAGPPAALPERRRRHAQRALDRVRDSSTGFGVVALVASIWIGSSFWGALDTAFCRIYHVRCRTLARAEALRARDARRGAAVHGGDGGRARRCRACCLGRRRPAARALRGRRPDLRASRWSPASLLLFASCA